MARITPPLPTKNSFSAPKNPTSKPSKVTNSLSKTFASGSPSFSAEKRHSRTATTNPVVLSFLDFVVEHAEIKPVFEKHFIPVKLVVQESEKNKALENAGADALFKKVGGPDGLPYSAFLAAQGALIVNSKRPGGGGRNIGYPAEPTEGDWFVLMMK